MWEWVLGILIFIIVFTPIDDILIAMGIVGIACWLRKRIGKCESG